MLRIIVISLLSVLLVACSSKIGRTENTAQGFKIYCDSPEKCYPLIEKTCQDRGYRVVKKVKGTYLVTAYMIVQCGSSTPQQ